MADNITYAFGGIADFASGVGTRAAQLMEIHDDIVQRTNAIADFFRGEAATAFHDAQMQMLRGLEGLTQTVSQHAHVVNQTAENAQVTDNLMSQGFTA